MNAIVICECSDTVTDALKAVGVNARSCDFKPSEHNRPDHIQTDCRTLDYSGIDLVIAFPDCTYLASSGLHWNHRTPKRQQKTEEALDFVRWILALPVPRIALENPIGCISSRIRKPDQIIQPYQFGHGETKATCLWLKGLPRLTPTEMVDGREGKVWKMPPSDHRKADRARTYQGIAQAMASQWSDLQLTIEKEIIPEPVYSEGIQVTNYEEDTA